jgi:hypothetical protein
MCNIITGNQISLFKLLALKSVIKLEILGIKRRGPSAYSIAKKQYGFKGNRISVLKQVELLIVEAEIKSREVLSE